MDGIWKPKIFNDGTVCYANLTDTFEPYNVHEALSNSQWKVAMEDEYAALMKNKTWKLPPPPTRPECNWVFKVKQ
jgi:hypothetical protein